MAYFSALGGTGGTSATITVTYSEDFYGTTITATNGTTTLTKTATSSGEVVFTVSEGGTWIVSGVVEGSTYSEQVDVTFEYITPQLIALPDGSTATPVNSIAMWLKCAMIRDKSYTTLSQVLGDTETFIALCADSNACDYMARSTNWASGVAADSTAMLIVGKYNYCANKLISNATWAEELASSTYWQYVFDVSVPTMTSNTTPSGVASASTEASAPYAAWKAFDSSEVQNNYWQTTPNAGVGSWIQYEFTEPVEISKIMILPYGNTYSPKSTKIQAYVDGSWEDIATGTLVDSFTKQYLYVNTLKSSTKVRAYFETAYGTTIAICQIQFYGRTPVSQTHTLIHSAVEDSIFYMDEGTPVALCTIASGDTEDVDMESFKGQTLTLVSTVAKDPTNLSNDFSMNVRITPNITEIYLMPLFTVYWYGYKVVESTNATYLGTNDGVALTYNKDDASLSPAPTSKSHSRWSVFDYQFVARTVLHSIYNSTHQSGNIGTSGAYYVGAFLYKSSGGTSRCGASVVTSTGNNPAQILEMYFDGVTTATLKAIWLE